MKYLFFNDWEGLYHIVICAFVSYIAMFSFIRISGKRTLAKLNAFDFIVSVSLGSTLSSMILKKVPIAEAMVALMVIIGLQFLLAYMAKHSESMEKVINNSPTLLFYNGEFIDAAMKKEVITKEEILAEIRKAGIEPINDVRAVVMELTGDLTVVKKSEDQGRTSLQDLQLHE